MTAAVLASEPASAAIDIVAANEHLKDLDPFKRLKWCMQMLPGKLCITSSFGIQAAIMAHVVSEVDNSLPILFINTGYHFSATLAYKDYLAKRLNLNIIEIKPELTRMEFEAQHNFACENNHNLCCKYNKQIPLMQALRDYKCWVTGIRRGQTQERNEIEYIKLENPETGLYKVSPIADYDDTMVKLHYQLYNLPEHPLARKGYTSVGCDECTKKALPGQGGRSGRWAGKAKKECGIHQMFSDGSGI